MSEQRDEHPMEAPGQPDRQGVAGRLAQGFIRNPVTVLLFFAAIAAGIIGLIQTPREEDPQISVPMVDIAVSLPGASGAEVQRLVTEPLERMMREVSGVKHVYSTSSEGRSLVTVRFEVGEETEPSLVKIYDRLQSNSDKMPPGATWPLIRSKGVNDVPIVTLTLHSQSIDDATLGLLGRDIISKLHEIQGVSSSFIVEGRTEQVSVTLSPERLSGFHLSPAAVAKAIEQANEERSVGQATSGDRYHLIYSGSQLASPSAIDNVMVGSFAGQPVYVRDVATIEHGPGERGSAVVHTPGEASAGVEPGVGRSAVTLAIAKKAGTNGVEVANAVLDKMADLERDLIPENVSVSVTRNYGESANKKVNELIFKLFVATLAVTLLVWLALGWRAALVVLAIIPIVILFTVFAAWLMGYSINRVSLFALIFSIGILVDDAIVVVENIYRRWLLDENTDDRVTVDAVDEVGNPTILATFTVIAALLPMGFVTGLMGPYMEPIPALGTVAMAFSIVAAFVFTPWLARKLIPPHKVLRRAGEKEHRQSDWLGRFYEKAMLGLYQDRKRGSLFLVGVVVAFFVACSLIYFNAVQVKMLPFDNKPEFDVVIDLPAGSSMERTASLARAVSEELSEWPEVVSSQSYIGTAAPFNFNGLVRQYYLRQQPWQGEVQVQLTGKDEREKSSHALAEQARERFAELASRFDARLQIVEMPPGPPVLQTVVAEVYGASEQARDGLARDLETAFTEVPNVGDVSSGLMAPHTNWRFVIDREKADRLGVSVNEINQTLSLVLGNKTLGDLRPLATTAPLPIVTRVSERHKIDPSSLYAMPVKVLPDGTNVTLGAVGQFVDKPAEQPIYRKDMRPVQYVTGEAIGTLAAPIYGMFQVEQWLEERGRDVETGFFSRPTPEAGEATVLWGGEWTVTWKTFRDMGIAFAVALILIYGLIVWEFGNFTAPAIVMAPIPLTLIGIVPGHWLLGADFSATSMIGFIALAGIIVRNSILLVDFARHELDKGVSIETAMVRACQSRTRPILITALALVLGSSVILSDPIFQGMAISLLFGVIVSTLLTLVVIPLGCLTARQAVCNRCAHDQDCDETTPRDGNQVKSSHP
ncbi:MAG: efflux RND transporter permease subunit [Halothiobacillaceae bacterium]|nr:efflux RND transporter permease subunit [Halothiobacillaceae bacterium]HER35632.1 efflux RND transporter permease subunit [Halothiobacillaceae bacterium]